MENTKSPTYGDSKVCYVEIPAVNIKQSSSFYEKVFGWTLRTHGDGHLSFDDGINEVSGTWVLGRKPATEPGLLVSIMVDSVAETTKVIAANGCRIVQVIATGDGQEIAWFADPAGNIIGIYQHEGGGHGKICYLEIPTENVKRAANFYSAIFKWQMRDLGTEHAAFDDGVGVVSGMWSPGRKPSAEPGLLVYMMMDSVADTVDTIIANGGKIVQPIGIGAPEITATFLDLDGNIFGLYQNP
jgi:hypothetical protein